METQRLLIDLPESLETHRLRLHMPTAGFGEQVHAAIMDGYSDYVRWMNWSPVAPTVSEVEAECRQHHAAFILREYIRYIIIEKSTDQVVGRIAFPSFLAHWQIPQFGISYFIRASARGKGYASEANHAMTLLAFQILQAKKVEIFCDAENKASWRVPEKLGFQHEYTQRGYWPRQDGALAELRTYALFDPNQLQDPSF